MWWLENYKPGVMERLGLEFETLTQINPKIIVCSISGYGQYGPYRDRAAGDHAIQAMSGLMWMTGEEEGSPIWGGSAYTDVGAGVHAFGAICAALLRRHSTGEGERIDVSLFDCAFWQHEFAVEQFLQSDGAIKPQRMGDRRVGTAPSGIYRGPDGYIALVVFSDSGWETLAEAIGQPELAQAPRFINREARWAHADDVDQIVLTEVDDQVLGRVMVQSRPVKFSHGVAAPITSAPLLGEHTRPVLRDLLGLSDARIQELQVDDRVLPAVVEEGA